MDCWITCSGTPIGAASIAPFAGLTHAALEALAAYASVRYHAIAAGTRLRRRLIWNAVDGDFAEEFSRTWDGGRLAVTDASGTEVGVASVVVLEDTHARIFVVVDARPDMARVEALLQTIRRDDDGRSRPAA